MAVFTDAAALSTPNELPGIQRATEYRAALLARDKVRWEQMYFGLLPELLAAIQKFKPEIIHANSHETAILSCISALELGIPVVATFHEQSPERTALGLGRCRFVYRALELKYIVAGSRFYYDKAISQGAPTERVRLIPHGIDTLRFRPLGNGPVMRKRWGFSRHNIVIICAARISVRKGQLSLARAFAQVRAALPEARLVLAGSCHSGSIEYLEQIRSEISAMGIAEYVYFDEYLRPDDMPLAYAAADVVAQPSTEEGLGLAVIEAMACERCVVCTDVVGLREVIANPNVGVLVRAGDAEAFGLELLRVCRQPSLRAALGRAGRAHVLEHYQIDRMASSTKAIYQDALGANEKTSGSM